MLTGFQYFWLIVPVVGALAAWILMVYWASFHPEVRHIRDRTRELPAPGAADEGHEGQAAAGSVPEPRQPQWAPAPREEREPQPADRSRSAPGR